jgi:hypothetical protein
MGRKMEDDKHFDSYFMIRLKTAKGFFLVKLFVSSSVAKLDPICRLISTITHVLHVWNCEIFWKPQDDFHGSNATPRDTDKEEGREQILDRGVRTKLSWDTVWPDARRGMSWARQESQWRQSYAKRKHSTGTPPTHFPSDTATCHINDLKLGCLHPVACTRSGSGFPSNGTLVWIFYSVTATCFGLMAIFK